MKVGFCCLGSNLRENLMLDELKEKGWILMNKCNLHKIGEESTDHFLQYAKMRILWHILFSLFEVKWVLPSMVGETLSSQ